MVGVMAGRAIHDLLAVAHGEIVRNRDRLVVGDEEAILRAGRRTPGAYTRVGARLLQIDRSATAILVRATVLRHPCLMRAPAELGGLQAFGDKALHRPGVDEYVHRLRFLGSLRVTLGDMDALDAELAGELAPTL